jgi:hypothetical protein
MGMVGGLLLRGVLLWRSGGDIGVNHSDGLFGSCIFIVAVVVAWT